MKELKFNEEMQRAKDEGRKTQTRRVVDPQPYIDKMGNWCWNGSCFGQDSSGPNIQAMATSIPWVKLGTEERGYYPQYGIVGDINNGCLITDIQVERLHDISEEDCIKEGIEVKHDLRCADQNNMDWYRNYGESHPDGGPYWYASPIGSFRSLWKSIYPNHPTKEWGMNPYVWVITFENI